MLEKNEILKEIINNLKSEIEDSRNNFNAAQDKAQKDIFWGEIVGFRTALFIIQRTILTWYPHDTDEEERAILKFFDLDFDIDEKYL